MENFVGKHENLAFSCQSEFPDLFLILQGAGPTNKVFNFAHVYWL